MQLAEARLRNCIFPFFTRHGEICASVRNYLNKIVTSRFESSDDYPEGEGHQTVGNTRADNAALHEVSLGPVFSPK